MPKKSPFQMVNVRRSSKTAAKYKQLAKLLTKQTGKRHAIADAADIAADEALARRKVQPPAPTEAAR